jgi:lipoprotein-anchoring transpeptidase ErfK/SrfK
MSRPSLLTIAGVLLVAMLGLMAVAASQRARAQRDVSAAPRTAAAAAPTAPPLVQLPAGRRGTRPAPTRAPTFTVARIRPGRTVALRSKPGGRVLANVGSTTRFGSPTTLAAAVRRGRWLGMTSTDLPNGKLGWVQAADPALRAHRTHISIRIDLSSRRLELRDGRRTVRRASVGVGRAGSPTPTGRFSVTDKLNGGAYGAFYGCCILALSGHQVHTPPGWQGGDRLAIHGSDDPGSIGVPSSAGCLHADAEDLKVMMRRVPLGTPVVIRA